MLHVPAIAMIPQYEPVRAANAAACSRGQARFDRHTRGLRFFMYKKFFGLRENPFNVNPDPRYLFFTQAMEEACRP